MKNLLKIGIISLLLCSAVVLFSFLGYNNMDYFIIFLTCFGIGMSIFIFYKNAIKKDYKLFTITIVFIIMFFSFFAYKKSVDRKNAQLMKNLIEVNKTLLKYKYTLKGLSVDVDLNEKEKEYESNFNFVKDHNKKIDEYLNETNKSQKIAVSMLSKYQLSNLSSNIIIEMRKYIEEFNQSKDKLENYINDLKNNKKSIEEKKSTEINKVKDIIKKKEEEKKRQEEEEKRKKQELEEAAKLKAEMNNKKNKKNKKSNKKK